MATAIKILVIDDNPMIRELVGRGLESFGKVQLAADGAEALQQLETATPELVIVDAELGSRGDPSLLEELRRRLTAPLILLSARDSGGESHRPFDDSVDEIIEKPFLIRDLQSRVRRIVERINLERMTRSVGGNSVRGTLAQMSVTDLVQSLEMGRKSCCLALTGAAGRQPENGAESSGGSTALRNVFRGRATGACRQRLGAGRRCGLRRAPLGRRGNLRNRLQGHHRSAHHDAINPGTSDGRHAPARRSHARRLRRERRRRRRTDPSGDERKVDGSAGCAMVTSPAAPRRSRLNRCQPSTRFYCSTTRLPGDDHAARTRELLSAAQVFRDAGVEVELEPTLAKGEGGRQAKAALARGFDAIFACGGDGTVFDVLQGMVHGPEHVALGVLPLGTANVLATDLGLPGDIKAAARATLGLRAAAHSRRTDALELECRISRKSGTIYFSVAAGIGAHAELIYDATTLLKQRGGFAAYYIAGLSLLVSHDFTRILRRDHAAGRKPAAGRAA